jgi:hypothetical protein
MKGAEMRKISMRIVVWLVSMFAVGIWAYAQAPVQPAPPLTPRGLPPGQDEPTRIISGNDIGFRIEDVRSNRLVGRFVVRVNGQWRDVEEAGVMKRLTER